MTDRRSAEADAEGGPAGAGWGRDPRDHALPHFVPDEQDPYGIAGRLMDEPPPGAALSITRSTDDFAPEAERFFGGLERVEPGVVTARRWRPEERRERLRAVAGPTVKAAETSPWAGVGVKR